MLLVGGLDPPFYTLHAGEGTPKYWSCFFRLERTPIVLTISRFGAFTPVGDTERCTYKGGSGKAQSRG